MRMQRIKAVRWRLALGVLGLTLAALGLAAWIDKPARAADERLPTIQEIMQQSHRCRNNYIYLVRRELQKEQPDWYVLDNRSEDLMRMGRLLGKNVPPRGSSASWARLTGVYVAHATLLNDAVQRQDKKTAQMHQQGLSSLCSKCHHAHRGH